MPETTFIIDLKEMVSAGLRKMQGVSKTVFDDIGKEIGVTKKGLTDLGTPTTLKVDSSPVAEAAKEVRKLKEQVDNLHESNGRATGSMRSMWDMARGSFAGNLAARGVEEGLRLVKEVGMSAIDKGFETERQMVGLSVFVGDAKAKQVYEGLQKQAVMTPFQTADMLPIEMGLVATGMTPERANKDMMSLMNAVAATGGNEFMLSLTGGHLAQAAAAGQIDGRILNEFQKTAHIPIQRLIADDLYPNLSHEAGVKKVKDMGTITYDQFTHALQRASEAGGLFAGGMEKLSQTMSGKWSTIKDFWGIGLSKLTMSQHDNIIKLEDQLISGLEKFPGLIAEMEPVVSRLFTRFNELWPTVKTFGSELMEVLKPFGSLLLSKEFGDLAKSSLELAGSIGTALLPILKDMADTFRDVMPPVAALTHWISDVVKGLGGVLDLINQVITGHIKKAENTGPDYIHQNSPSGMAPGFAVSDLTPKADLGIVAAPWDKWSSDKSKPAAASAPTLGGTAETITKGGSRAINITFRNLVEHFTVQNNGNVEKSAKEMEEYFIENLRRVVQLLPG
jgi:hypothetical protein